MAEGGKCSRPSGPLLPPRSLRPECPTSEGRGAGHEGAPQSIIALRTVPHAPCYYTFRAPNIPPHQWLTSFLFSPPSAVACRGGCCGCLTLTTIIMFAMSWSSLDFQEYGLDYNGWRQTVTTSAAGSGRYFLGVGHEFLVFPKVYQTIEYSEMADTTGPAVQSRTKDGVEVILSVSFQYQLLQENIHDLFQAYGIEMDGTVDEEEGEEEPYKRVFSYVARDSEYTPQSPPQLDSQRCSLERLLCDSVLTDVSTEYNAFEFFSNRTNIGERMSSELRMGNYQKQ